ncbi:MAG: hypothetical protein WA821_08285 [Anaerolineales bacterium]
MQNLEKQHIHGRFLTGMRAGSQGISRFLRKYLRLAVVVCVLLVSALFIRVNMVSAKAAAVDTSTFCTQVTSYGGITHCQTGDKTTMGWYDKAIPKQLPPIAGLKTRNLEGNPPNRGFLTIYTPQLYCAAHWSDFVGHGYVEVNGQRFATCRQDVANLGPGGYNQGADYLFVKASMVRIVTNIKVFYGQTIVIKIYGRIYASNPSDCRKEEHGECLYPGISPGWVYAYTKTGTRDTDLARFYKSYKTFKNWQIYDFLTILYGDFDLDNKTNDYYDFDDLYMTFALTGP